MKPTGPRSPRRSKTLHAVILAGSIVVGAAPASAAVNAYLYLDGIPGPSTSKAGFIDILSYSVGVALADPTKTQKAVCSNLSLMKVVDFTSPKLFQAALAGKPLATATLVYDKPVGDRQEDYYSVTLTNVYITSVEQSGSNENPTESLSLAAKTVTISYRPEKDDGSLDNPIVTTLTCP